MCVQNCIKLSAAVHELWTVHSISNNSIDRLWSRISLERIKQSTSWKRRHQLRFFSTFDEKIFGELWITNEKITLTFDLWPWNLIGFYSRDCRGTCSCKISPAVHELSCQCPQAFCPVSQWWKNPKIQSCDLDLWPVTLKLCRFRAIVKEHVYAKFHQAKCSG